MTMDTENFRNIKIYTYIYNEWERPLRFETDQINEHKKEVEYKDHKSA